MANKYMAAWYFNMGSIREYDVNWQQIILVDPVTPEQLNAITYLVYRDPDQRAVALKLATLLRDAGHAGSLAVHRYGNTSAPEPV